MQKSKSHSLVIFPSRVKNIPFTVPGLSSSSFCCPPSSSSDDHADQPLSSGDDLKPCCGGGGIGSRLTSRSALDVEASPLTLASTPNRLGGRRPSTLERSTGLSDSSLRQQVLSKSSTGERWASVPCCLGPPHDDHRTPVASGAGAGGGVRGRTDNRISCGSFNRDKTIDLKHANSLFGIDPSLYLSAESGLDETGSGYGWREKDDDDDDDDDTTPYDDSNIGRVWFALQYDADTERLLISLVRIRNLPKSFATNQNARDPIVRIWLMPDERRWVQAKFKRKTCNPRFNENFAFQVSGRDFADRSIKLTVYGSGDRHSRRQVAFGHVVYPLRDHMCEPNERIVTWRDLQKESTTQRTNPADVQLHLSLSYSSESGRLSVALHSGKNFTPAEDEDPKSNEFYVVVSQMEMSKVVKKKKTGVVKQSLNFSPIFNELFHFKVRQKNIDITSLLICAKRHDSGHKGAMIGRLVLGSFMFARGTELDHWNAMLNNENQQISRWHTLTN